MTTRRTGNAPVHSITSAAAPLGDDIAKRARRYLAQMALRTLCFIGAVATWGLVPTWVSVSLLVGAVILPYVAVVLANAGRERPEKPDPFADVVRQLATTPAADAGSPLDARYGRAPSDQAAHQTAYRRQSGPAGPRPAQAGHPFDRARSDRARSEQSRFDDVRYDRVPFDTAASDRRVPFEDAPRTTPPADGPGREGAVGDGPPRG